VSIITPIVQPIILSPAATEQVYLPEEGHTNLLSASRDWSNSTYWGSVGSNQESVQSETNNGLDGTTQNVTQQFDNTGSAHYTSQTVTLADNSGWRVIRVFLKKQGSATYGPTVNIYSTGWNFRIGINPVTGEADEVVYGVDSGNRSYLVQEWADNTNWWEIVLEDKQKAGATATGIRVRCLGVALTDLTTATDSGTGTNRWANAEMYEDVRLGNIATTSPKYT
jgi:hypothetical protein